MTTQISAETLAPITHNQIPVITTELLAQLYGTETNNIKVNFSRNSERFVCGKHYFKIEGDELRAMKHEVTQSNSVKIARNVRSLILWTERGAARHAKMLETDQAWEVFEKLEDCYFNQKTPQKSESAISNIPFPKEQRFIVAITSDGKANIQQIEDDMFVGKVIGILSDLRKRGWIVIKRELLAEKLANW
ncbi:TPA: ORF6N domain-containing protein [Salmonella enterica subsp. enterica serovar Concord]|nr:ORF6N domain-containing protein [Salmonella enterica subsp. enterica serovar Concord]